MVTGHSLGGALAEMYASENSARFTSPGHTFSCVTFESPGIPGGVYNDSVTNFQITNDFVPNVPFVDPIGNPFNVTMDQSPNYSLTDFSNAAAVDLHNSFESVASILIESGLYNLSSNLFSIHVESGNSDAKSLSSLSTAVFMLGADGNDTLIGSSVSDLVDGGGGSDVLSGGRGADTLAGGASSDQFIFGIDELTDARIGLRDVIYDYNQGNVIDASSLPANYHGNAYSFKEGDIVGLYGITFATSSHLGNSSVVRVREDSRGGFAWIQINPTGGAASGAWINLVMLKGVVVGDDVAIAMSTEQLHSGTGTMFTVEPPGGERNWTLSPSAISTVEGSGDHVITFTLIRTNAIAGETVYFSTTMTHGSYNNKDYAGLSNFEVNFLKGQTVKTVDVTIHGDSFAEGDETFGAIIQSIKTTSLANPLVSGTFTITNDDTPVAPTTGITWVGDNFANNKSGTSHDDNLTGLGGADVLMGNAGNDNLYGGTGNGTYFGGSGNDFIDASTGLDKVYGGDGDDTVVVGGGGVDQIYGGLGFDVLTLDRSSLTTDQIVIFRQGGNSTTTDGTIVSGFEALSLTTGSGNDTVTLAPVFTAQYFNGGGGTDLAIVDYSGFSLGVTFSSGDNTVYGSSHFDIDSGSVVYDNAIDFGAVEKFDITGGSGNDDLEGDTAGSVTLRGNAGDDYLVGSTGSDQLYGGSGNDTIVSGHGTGDTIDGGTGIDFLYIDRSASTGSLHFLVDGVNGGTSTLADGTTVQGIEGIGITTGSGNDVSTFLNPGSLTQYFNGGGGTDLAIVDYSGFSLGVTFSSGDNTVYGSSHFDIDSGSVVYDNAIDFGAVEKFDITGGSGNDDLEGDTAGSVTLRGNAGDDYLVGSTGSDQLYGGSGNDTIVDGGGNDSIYGGTGRDTIDGGNGNDRINGGAGNDILAGGNGSDRFIFAAGFGHDRITDFVAGAAPGDVLDFFAMGISLADLNLTSTGGGTNTLITVIATGDSVLLVGTASYGRKLVTV